MALITLRGVNAGYGPVHLIENASLSFEKGDRIALTGRNGCGKTTLLRLLNRLEDPPLRLAFSNSLAYYLILKNFYIKLLFL